MSKRKTTTSKAKTTRAARGTKPLPPLTQGQLGALLGTSQQRVSQLVKEGLFSARSSGRIDPFVAVPAYCRAIRKVPDGAMVRIRELRARELEQRIEREARRLISVDEIDIALGEIIGVFCSELHGVAAASTRDLPMRATIQDNINGAIGRCKARLDSMADAAKSGRPLIADEEGEDDDDEN